MVSGVCVMVEVGDGGGEECGMKVMVDVGGGVWWVDCP